MKKRWPDGLLSILACIPAITVVALAASAETIQLFKPKQGKLIRYEANHNACTYILGHGAGGTVVRVINRDGTISTIKSMHQEQGVADERAHLELARLFLKKESFLNVIEIYNFSRNTITLENLMGQDVGWFLTNDQIPVEIRREFAHRLNRSIENLLAGILTKFGDAVKVKSLNFSLTVNGRHYPAIEETEDKIEMDPHIAQLWANNALNPVPNFFLASIPSKKIPKHILDIYRLSDQEPPDEMIIAPLPQNMLVDPTGSTVTFFDPF